MRILVLAVGRIRERGLRELLSDYYNRVGRYARIEERELADGDAAEVSARLARAIPERSRVVALEVEGRALSSVELARFIERAQLDAVGTLVFLIGGAYGLPAELSRAADHRLSLSAMTLPHRLARLMLAEQVYRAFTILRGEPYSH